MGENAALIRRWFDEVWNQGREATIHELCAPEATGHGQTADGSDIVGPETFKKFWQTFREAFSAIHVDIHEAIEQGDIAVARWTISMTHAGPFMGIDGSGKKISATGMSMQRFKDGKIVEAWDNWNQLGLMSQLGVISLEEMNHPRVA